KHGGGYRQLHRSVALEGFAELVARADGKRLTILFQLLAEHWQRYQSMLDMAEVSCYRADCAKWSRTQQVPSFFAFLLRSARWIPALTTARDGKRRLGLHAARKCWFVPAAENPAVRALL